MSIQDANAAYVPPQTAYGRYVRERGTRRLIVIAGCLAVAWYAYSSVHTHLLMQVKWSRLAPEPNGLTVVGLRDKDRPGWHHVYEARESNHAWQVRYAEDASAEDVDNAEKTPEQQDQQGHVDPGAYHRGNSGAVVPVDTVLKTCPAVLVGRNFDGASITEGYDEFYNKPYYRLVVSLTEEGRSRYYQWSHLHDQERLAFILNDFVLACPRMDNLDVTSLTIDPIWDKKDAQTLCDFINNQKR